MESASPICDTNASSEPDDTDHHNASYLETDITSKTIEITNSSENKKITNSSENIRITNHQVIALSATSKTQTTNEHDKAECFSLTLEQQVNALESSTPFRQKSLEQEKTICSSLTHYEQESESQSATDLRRSSTEQESAKCSSLEHQQQGQNSKSVVPESKLFTTTISSKKDIDKRVKTEGLSRPNLHQRKDIESLELWSDCSDQTCINEQDNVGIKVSDTVSETIVSSIKDCVYDSFLIESDNTRRNKKSDKQTKTPSGSRQGSLKRRTAKDTGIVRRNSAVFQLDIQQTLPTVLASPLPNRAE